MHYNTLYYYNYSFCNNFNYYFRSRSFSPRARKVPSKSVVSPPPKPRVRARPPSPAPVPRRLHKPTTPPPMQRKMMKPSPSDRPTDPRRQPPPPRPRGSTGEIINVRGVKPPVKLGAVKKPGEKGMVKPVSYTTHESYLLEIINRIYIV